MQENKITYRTDTTFETQIDLTKPNPDDAIEEIAKGMIDFIARNRDASLPNGDLKQHAYVHASIIIREPYEEATPATGSEVKG